MTRFLAAQQAVYPDALAELRAGMKRSHWMWFVFPQMRGLGSSPMAVRYGIASLDEARAYWRHPVLGARLRECIAALLALPGRSAETVFGDVDAMKLRSCLTLFDRVAPDGDCQHALVVFFAGERDPRTLALLPV